jgi:hypothetical protein
MSSSIGTQNSSRRLLQYRELAAVLLQVLVVVLVFKKLVFHPGQYLLVDYYDGLKSYFSIEAFLRQPLADGMLVRGHNYPFGEYMYYTDSTPLLVQSLHLLVRAFPALAPYGLYFYDLFIIGGLIFSTWLLHRIIRPMGLPGWLAVIVSVALPWLCPQAIRMQVGHMSLSYAPAMLFTFWVMQQLYLTWMAGQQSGRKWFIWLFIGIFIASYLHFYYLGVLGVLCGFFFLFWVIREYQAGRPWLRLAQYAITSLVAALVTTAGLLMFLDPRYNERPVGSGGYDWIYWKFQFGSLFRGYEYNKIRFPFEQLEDVPYESSSYLTAFVLYGLLVVAVLSLMKRQPRIQFLEKPIGQFLWLFFLASLPLVSISLGEEYLLGNDKYMLHNYSNPFLWLHRFTERVTQFRALGRFIWPFWWAMLLGFSWYVAHWWRHRVLRWFLLALVLLLILDTRDALHFYSSKIQRPNVLTAAGPTTQTRQFLSWIEAEQYQALLPFPLYHSGSEGTPYYNVDGDDAHSTLTYQLSMITNLPMMSHKATRSVSRDAQLIVTVVQPGGPDPELMTKLDERPILVYLDSSYYNGQNNYYRDQLKDRPEMLALFERTGDFIREQHMKRIRHKGTQSLYEWYPKGPKPQSSN